MKRLLLLFAAVCIAGCGLLDSSDDPSGDVLFTADQNTFALGEPITATLTNGTDDEVGYNLCFSRLERQENDGWVLVPPVNVCQAILYRLTPDETSQYRITADQLDDGLTAGTYRITTDVEIDGESATLSTTPFDVQMAAQ